MKKTLLEDIAAAVINAIKEIKRLEGKPLLIAVEGRCASGKTTLASALQKALGCYIFHMDDFFLRPEQRTPERLSTPGGNIDWERFEQEVLIPIKQKQPVNYRRYDCHAAAFLPPTVIRPQKLNIIEGNISHEKTDCRA